MLHWVPIKEKIILKITNFAFHFLDGTCHHACHPVSVYTPPRALHSSPDFKKTATLFLVQDGNLRALVISHSVFSLPQSVTTSLLKSNIAFFSHSSELHFLEPVSLVLPTQNYFNPVTGIGSCTSTSLWIGF